MADELAHNTDLGGYPSTLWWLKKSFRSPWSGHRTRLRLRRQSIGCRDLENGAGAVEELDVDLEAVHL